MYPFTARFFCKNTTDLRPKNATRIAPIATPTYAFESITNALSMSVSNFRRDDGALARMSVLVGIDAYIIESSVVSHLSLMNFGITVYCLFN